MHLQNSVPDLAALVPSQVPADGKLVYFNVKSFPVNIFSNFSFLKCMNLTTNLLEKKEKKISPFNFT